MLYFSVKRGIIHSHRDLNSVVDDMFRFHRAVFYSQLKSKVGNIFVKVAILCINLNIDDVFTHSPLTHSNLSPFLLVHLLRYSLPPFHPVWVRI